MAMKKLTITIDEDTVDAILEAMGVEKDIDQKTLEAEVSEYIMQTF